MPAKGRIFSQLIKSFTNAAFFSLKYQELTAKPAPISLKYNAEGALTLHYQPYQVISGSIEQTIAAVYKVYTQLVYSPHLDTTTFFYHLRM